MSIVTNFITQIDAQLNQIPLPTVPASVQASAHDSPHQQRIADVIASPRIQELTKVVKKLSASSAAQLSPGQIKQLLENSPLFADSDRDATVEASSDRDDLFTTYENEIAWRLVGKAAIQTFGLVASTFLEQNIHIQDDIWYWNRVLNSPAYTSYFTIQTSPLRLWHFLSYVYVEAKRQIRNLPDTISPRPTSPSSSPSTSTVPSTAASTSATKSTTSSWLQLYTLVRETVRERARLDIRSKVLSPFELCQEEARAKRARLRKLRRMTASGLGVLIDEGLVLGEGRARPNGEEDDLAGVDSEFSGWNTWAAAHNAAIVDWKGPVEKSVALIDHVLAKVLVLDQKIQEFEEEVFASVDDDDRILGQDDSDTYYVEGQADHLQRPRLVAQRLLQILDSRLPNHITATKAFVNQHGRPANWIRWWIPVTIGLFSSSTVLHILLNRKADIMQWMRDAADTLGDFYRNWVIQPVTKVIQTIRHDDSSEIALMSKDSLRSDLESLERMVVSFALEKPEFAITSDATSTTPVVTPSSLTEDQIALIRSRVSAGDVTPVARAYEQGLAHPIRSMVRGDLVRALLIQIQKAKVDMKVALGGIDSLLKSQELVFRFVGLTPGLLVSVGLFQWMRGALLPSASSASAKGTRRVERTRSLMVLRNMDRILSEASFASGSGDDETGSQGVLSYQDHGQLFCEIHVLRNLVQGSRLMPRDVEESFLEDLETIAREKIPVQKEAMARLRWTYQRWFNTI